MQRLNRGMMERYEIEDRRPGETRAVQFGAGEALLGAADPLLDTAGVGVACVIAGEDARRLRDQDGMYTLLVRGYEGETPVRRETVVQCLREVIDPEADFDALTALARREALALGVLDVEAPGAELDLTLAARLLAERWRAGLGGLDFLCAGADGDAGQRAEAFIRRVSEPWGLGEGFGDWLAGRNGFHPMLAERLAFRATPGEAAKVCADMNYEDGLLHVAEPFVRLTVAAPEAVRARHGLDAPGLVFAPDLEGALARKRRVYDAALVCLAAPGWLLGCNTLADCVKHERLRAFVGNAVYRELLPTLPMAREDAAAAIIESFGRFENPLNDNSALRAARPMLRRVEEGLLPAIRAHAEAHFEAPEGLSFALAAVIMLYAGAREEDGAYRVARGKETVPLSDDPRRLKVFSTLSHDMPPEALAYAALADRELWNGMDLRDIDGLEDRVALHLAAMQRDPSWLPAAPGT